MTDFRLDPADDVQGRALAALESEEIGWLGSTGRDDQSGDHAGKARWPAHSVGRRR